MRDNRPRFGWCDERAIDNDPQVIQEKRPKGKTRDFNGKVFPVVVIPLPYISSKVKHKIREFTNGTLWPKEKQ